MMDENEVKNALTAAMESMQKMPSHEAVGSVSRHYMSLISSVGLYDEWLDHGLNQNKIRFEHFHRKWVDDESGSVQAELSTERDIYEYQNLMLKKNLRDSQVVQIWSAFEAFCRGFCKVLQMGLNLPLSIDNIHGSNGGFLKSYKLFLDKYVSTPSLSDTVNWKDISQLYLLRNCIVHNAGRIDGNDNNRSLQNYIKQRKDLIFLERIDLPFYLECDFPDSHMMFIIQAEYIGYISNTVTDYIEKVSKLTDVLDLKNPFKSS